MVSTSIKLYMARRIAICLILIVIASGGVYGQSNNTPEGCVKSFYSWYLTTINKQKDPAKNKTVMNSHLSKRFSRWFYSKAGQSVDYDVFINTQDWAEAWADNIKIGKAVFITDNNVALHVSLSSPPDEFVMKLQVRLVKEGGKWKIDRVAGLFD